MADYDLFFRRWLTAGDRLSAHTSSAAAAGATEQSSMTAIAARLDDVAAFAQVLAGRVDRIGAISEQALLAVADLHHRIGAGVPRNPPQEFGVLRWSLRQPRKALRAVLKRLRTLLKEPVAEPQKRAAPAAVALSNESAAGIRAE
jgi:hypothetical protein